jgi:hypothetical protein
MKQSEDMQSWRYWNQCEERVAQHYYVTLCLYISAASDFAVALDLTQQKKLNWATTAAYYSIVHSGRMIAFAAVGDFPRGHKYLASLFHRDGGSTEDRRLQAPGRVRCNWLQEFTRAQGALQGKPTEITFEELINYYEDVLMSPHAARMLEDFSLILQNAKSLREDCNYEALLVAHEYDHIKVTDVFRDLAPTMCKGAGRALETSTALLEQFVLRSPALRGRRQVIEYMTSFYVKERLLKSISQRTKFRKIMKVVERLAKPLADISKRDVGEGTDEFTLEQFQRLDRFISLEMFGDKAYLMNECETKKNRLKADIQAATRV